MSIKRYRPDLYESKNIYGPYYGARMIEDGKGGFVKVEDYSKLEGDLDELTKTVLKLTKENNELENRVHSLELGIRQELGDDS